MQEEYATETQEHMAVNAQWTREGNATLRLIRGVLGLRFSDFGGVTACPSEEDDE